jgi:hypothetical protein
LTDWGEPLSEGEERGGVLDGAVNKRPMSTRESGEFETENVGIGLNPGVERATGTSVISNERDTASGKACGMWRIRTEAVGRRCQQD